MLPTAVDFLSNPRSVSASEKAVWVPGSSSWSAHHLHQAVKSSDERTVMPGPARHLSPMHLPSTSLSAWNADVAMVTRSGSPIPFSCQSA